MLRLRVISVGLALLGIVASTVTVGHVHADDATASHACVVCMHADTTSALEATAQPICRPVVIVAITPDARPLLPIGRTIPATGRAPPHPRTASV